MTPKHTEEFEKFDKAMDKIMSVSHDEHIRWVTESSILLPFFQQLTSNEGPEPHAAFETGRERRGYAVSQGAPHAGALFPLNLSVLPTFIQRRLRRRAAPTCACAGKGRAV